MPPPSGLVYRVPSHLVDAVISHRYLDENEQYLVRWQCGDQTARVLSWHPLPELQTSLNHVQEYVKVILNGPRPPPTEPRSKSVKNGMHNGLKRKRCGDDDASSIDSHGSSANSYTKSSSVSAASTSSPAQNNQHEVYNGLLQRKAGFLVAKQSSDPAVPHVGSLQLPDAEMLATASNTSVYDALYEIRNKFVRDLACLPGPSLTFHNPEDYETPSLSFRWIQDYVLGEGVERVDGDFVEGCAKCKPDMGLNRGCEYTQKCGCLEYAAPDPKKIREDQQELYEQWLDDNSIDTTGLPKRFPYTSTGARTGCLESFYLNSRYVIYECNAKCRCGKGCKTRNVQKGRTVNLQIFKTSGRGFGLRCLEPLRRGQFIDKYLGELVTDAEADKREAAAGTGKASYLFWLDKHMVEKGENGLQQQDCYVADGEVMGGPTRFINHSCDPNCRLFTVSYNKHDQKIYDLAFFALHDIPAGEELTFDYMDADPDEDEDQAAQNQREKSKELESLGRERVACYCGAENCRGYMWE